MKELVKELEEKLEEELLKELVKELEEKLEEELEEELEKSALEKPKVTSGVADSPWVLIHLCTIIILYYSTAFNNTISYLVSFALLL